MEILFGDHFTGRFEFADIRHALLHIFPPHRNSVHGYRILHPDLQNDLIPHYQKCITGNLKISALKSTQKNDAALLFSLNFII